jgi:hypothetical protein
MLAVRLRFCRGALQYVMLSSCMSAVVSQCSKTSPVLNEGVSVLLHVLLVCVCCMLPLLHSTWITLCMAATAADSIESS